MTKSNFNWLACLFGLLIPFTSQPAPGTIADRPLFTASGSGAGVPSNIFFQLDDSGSMDQDMLSKQYWAYCLYDPTAPSCSSASTLQTDGDFTLTGTNISSVPVADFTATTITDWRERSPGLNILYYNPSVTYVPWKPSSTTTYTDASYTAAKDDPNSGTTVNLTGFVFEVWHDTHGYTGSAPSITGGGSSSSRKVGTVITTTINQTINRSVGANGMPDFWDEHTRYQMPTGAGTSITQYDVTYVPTKGAILTGPTQGGSGNNLTVKYTYVQSLGETTATSTLVANTGLNGRTLAQEKTNIANWYQYYRRRINIARGAIGKVVTDNPNYRYGFNTIWNRAFVEVPASTVTDFTTPNKALLAAVYARSPSNGTPLPNALDLVGRYYQHANNLPAINTTGIGVVQYVDPIVYECQQNFAIMITDGYWNSDLNATPQAYIQDADGDGIGSSTDPTASQQHSTVADVARYYYNTDLSALADKVPVNSFDTNSKQHMVSFLVAFGLQGLLTDTDGDGWPNPALAENDNWGDPSGGSNILPKIDDLWHAAFNAKGLYISASSPEAISAGFAQILNNISQRDYKGSAASLSLNTGGASGSNSIFQSKFSLISNIWSGDLWAYDLLTDINGNLTGAVSTSPKWKAAFLLDSLSSPATSRHIFTYNRATHTGVPFQWVNLGNLGDATSTTVSEAQRDLGTNTSGVVSVVTTNSADAVNAPALARLAYLRGDTSNDGGGTYSFRNRAYTDTVSGVSHLNRLGDIIHSNPVLVSAPTGNWPTRSPFLAGGTVAGRYRAFAIGSAATRTPIVYVGANDGMLHGFNALTGAETMAYIPQTLFSSASNTAGLHYLTDPGYTHRYYVDMPPITEDVIINNSWKTILVGALGAGGRGIFALNINNPSVFGTENTTNAAQIPLWEFDSSDDADMGYSLAAPSIVMMNNNRWAVIVGNGYNSTNSTGNLGSNGGTPDSQGKEKGNGYVNTGVSGQRYSAGKASLFILFLDGGLDGVWTYGTDYIKITAPEIRTTPTSIADPTVTGAITTQINCGGTGINCNGLSTPQPVDVNGDRKIDRVYAGDVKGNMWAFDLRDSSPVNWGVAYGTATTPKPLFTASHHTGSPPTQTNLCASNTAPCVQPITGRPNVIKNSKGAGYPNMLVMFGTGQYLTVADTSNQDIQSFYGVWDHSGLVAPISTAVTLPLTPAKLVQQTISTVTVGSNTVRLLTKNSVTYRNNNSANQGWFINFPASTGERQIVDTDILDSKYLFFNTLIPGETVQTTAGACATQGNASGSSFLMSVDLFTGGEANINLFDLNGSGTIDSNDTVSGGHSAAGVAFTGGIATSSTFYKGTQYVGGTSSETPNQRTVVAPKTDAWRRRSWQELRTY